jgi:putative ABC transport system ATP-binding protein
MWLRFQVPLCSMAEIIQGETVVSVRSAAKNVPSGTSVLSGVDLEVNRGESLALLGRSGSGKSTLLACLGLLDRFDGGSYALLGDEIGAKPNAALDRIRGFEVGFVFQRFFLLSHLTVMDNVLTSFRHSSGAITKARRLLATDALDSVGMAAFSGRYPRQLSGGEQQRVAIARAVAKRPSLLLADEPTGALDERTGEDVVSVLLGLVNTLDSALIMVTHDGALAGRLGSTAELHDGEVRTVHGGASSARHRGGC